MLFIVRMCLVILLSLASLTSSWGREQPGPSADLLANPTYSAGIGLLYTCVTNYYVNANTGNDSNNGTSPGSAFATIQHADTIGGPGVCVNVAAGNYNFPTRYTPTKGGNASSPTGYMVYRCQVLNQCFTLFTENTFPPFYDRMWALSVPYIIIDGFDIDGGEAAVFGGRANVCISANKNDNPPPGHHLWVVNNNIHGCNLSCIQFGDTEYVFALHNNFYNCSWTNGFQGSGYSIATPTILGAPDSPYPPYTPTSYDKAFAPYTIITSWNKAWHNGCVTCTGEINKYSTTGDIVSGSTTLNNIANVGTSASFTGAFSANVNPDIGTMTVSGITGTISIGDVLTFTFNIAPNAGQTSFLAQTVLSQVSGTPGGNGVYTVSFPFQCCANTVPVNSATLSKGVYVEGPGILPFTYIQAITGNTATLTRPATATQVGNTVTFHTPSITNHTDGNGIIMDTYCSITTCGGASQNNFNDPGHQSLVSFNDTQFNGGRGVHLFATYYVTAVNNSTYHNGLDLYQNGFIPEINNSGVNNTLYNNNAVAVDSILTPCSFNFNFPTCNFYLVLGDGRGLMNASNTIGHNDTFGGGGAFITSISDNNAYNAGNNIVRDPLYVNGISSVMGNLQLQAGSPAINFGIPQAFPFLPKGTTDTGAWQTGGIRTAFSIGGTPEFSGSIGLQSLPIIQPPLSCPAADAWLARISGYDRVHHDVYSNLICGMVNAGIWCDTSLDVFYFFETYNQSTANMNLCSATNYAAVPNGNPTFTVDKGYTGVDASTTVFIDTQFDPFTAMSPFYTLNNGHLSVEINNNVLSTVPGPVNGRVIGVCCGGGGTTSIVPRVSAAPSQANFQVSVNNEMESFFHLPNQATSLGHFLATRTDSMNVNAYYDGALLFNYSQSSFITRGNIYVLAFNLFGTGAFGGGPYQVGAVTIGRTFNNTEQKNLCHLLRVASLALGNVAGTC